MDGREPDAGALELGLGVQPLERPEERAPNSSWSKPAPLSPTTKSEAAPSRRATRDADARVGPLLGELPGVAEQVLEHDRDQARIGGGGEAVFDVDGDVARRMLARAARRPRLVAISVRLTALRRSGPREMRDSSSKSSMSVPMRGSRRARAAGTRALLVELVGVVVEQRLAEAVDRAQRSAQIVRHRVAERLELVVRLLELRAPTRGAGGRARRGSARAPAARAPRTA